MSDIMLHQVSDKGISNEYLNQFFLKSGDKLSVSKDSANCNITSKITVSINQDYNYIHF